MTVKDVQVILATGMQLLALFRTARNRWRQANPDQPLPDGWPDDATLIDLLAQDAKALEDHATALLAKYGATPGP